ncbi:hypothetical protein [Rubritalea tangerina]
MNINENTVIDIDFRITSRSHQTRPNAIEIHRSEQTHRHGSILIQISIH